MADAVGLSIGECGVSVVHIGDFGGDMRNNWLTASAGDLGRGIGAGKIDPLELTECYLAAIDVHPLRDKIYSRVTRERALAEATAARNRARADQRLGVLDGVPVSWKDLFDSAGTATEAGSAYLKGRVPRHDAEVLETATKSGLVCLGKTHMSELAFSGLGYNPVTATPPCVNDAQAAPGGSSSGAATSVAFGLAACGMGSDTGGSVRIPSAWNDLTGLKTTHGLVSVRGVVPLCKSFDTVGPLCRNVEDAALMLSVLSGGPVADLGGASLHHSRFLVLGENGRDGARAEPAEGFDRAIDAIANAGGQIDHGNIDEIEEAMALSACLFTVEAYAQWCEEIEADPALMFDEILERFRAGAQFSGVEFVQSWQMLHKLRNRYLEKTAGYDAVLLPTSLILPPNLERLATDHDYYVEENLLALRNTRVGNLMGLCALSVPTGAPSCGLMMLAAPYSEARLLRTGAAVEKALGSA